MDSFLGQVVYLLNPTSNHNQGGITTATTQLYIFWILHQTTTISPSYLHLSSCISFESYIKPQHRLDHRQPSLVVYLLNPTSNHNPPALIRHCCGVVYLLNPTSNHNFILQNLALAELYIFWILHQTTTHRTPTLKCPLLYIFWILHQTTTTYLAESFELLLYIFWILHQTTTLFITGSPNSCCISFESYIKPQPSGYRADVCEVVYLLNPTSNHNCNLLSISAAKLHIFWILHQTTTDDSLVFIR